MDREELAAHLAKTAYLKGEFILRSGQTATEYFDKYLFEGSPELLQAIADELLNQLPEHTDILAGLEMGGIPIATSMSLSSKLPMVLVRKEAKPYGTAKLVEGGNVNGKRLTVIEDVITTGGQVLASVKEMRKLGAIVNDVMCVILRNPQAYTAFQQADLRLSQLFTSDEIKAALSNQ